MADEFLTKFYLGLHELLAASVLTPRERKFIEIINRQNAVLEQIAVGTLIRSPQEIANLAKGATVIIVEKGSDPRVEPGEVPFAQYAAKVTAEPASEPPSPELEAAVSDLIPDSVPEPATEPPKPVDTSVEERIKAFSAAKALKLVDIAPRASPEAPTTVGGGLSAPRRAEGEKPYSRRSHPDALPVLILAVTTLCSVLGAAFVV
jgi:hypothetical protein